MASGPSRKQAVVLIGQRKALAMAVKNNKTEQRFSGLPIRCKRRLKSAAGVTWVTRLGTASCGTFDNMKDVRRYGKLD